MFTGIVEEMGTVVSFEDHRLRIGAHRVLEDAHLGDAIAALDAFLAAEIGAAEVFAAWAAVARAIAAWWGCWVPARAWVYRA